MNKAYILAICMFGASFGGCIEDEDKPSSLEDAFNGFIDSITKLMHGEFWLYDHHNDYVTYHKSPLEKGCSYNYRVQ